LGSSAGLVSFFAFLAVFASVGCSSFLVFLVFSGLVFSGLAFSTFSGFLVSGSALSLNRSLTRSLLRSL